MDSIVDICFGQGYQGNAGYEFDLWKKRSMIEKRWRKKRNKKKGKKKKKERKRKRKGKERDKKYKWYKSITFYLI